MDKLVLDEKEWRRRLTAEQFDVLRRGGTEPAFTGCYAASHVSGTYVCAGCHQPLFASGQKFESGSGWPSFFETVEPGAVTALVDESHGMVRTEVRCGRCDGHLGHVFPDGPPPTGMRYCMNSASLLLVPEGQPLPPLER